MISINEGRKKFWDSTEIAKGGQSWEKVYNFWGLYTNYQSAKILPNVYNRDNTCSFSNEWLKTTNLQLSQEKFKTCLRKLTIIAPFIHRNNILFNLKKKKSLTSFFFSKLSQKRCQGWHRLHCQRPQIVLKRMKQKRQLKKRWTVKKSKKNKKNLIKNKQKMEFFLFFNF